MTGGTLNVMRREAERAMARRATVRMGKVSAYDPARYCAKVRLQPEDAETGWLPVATPWSGSGWGFFAPPSIGDVADVHFQEGHPEAGFVSQRFYSAVTRPLAVPPGELWVVHKNGGSFKLTNDGKITATDSAGSFLTLNADGTATLKADLIVQGTIRATGDITDRYLTNPYTIATLRYTYDIHTHNESIGSVTSVPNQLL